MMRAETGLATAPSKRYSGRMTLRERLARPGLIEAPGCFDALSARLIEQAGFPVAYLSGFGTAATLGFPDLGLVSFREMADRAATVADAISIPLIADADTGYGDVENVRRTVRTYARAGVAAVQLEDQVWPKRCGHTPGKRVISLTEATRKIGAAAEVAAAHGVLIVARTDARAVEGLDAALERCHAFADAGADILFVEAPESRAELARVAEEFDTPLLVNLIEGGKTPMLPLDKLESLGFKIAIRPLTLLAAATGSMQEHLRHFGPWERAPSFEELKGIVGFPETDTGSGSDSDAEGA